MKPLTGFNSQLNSLINFKKILRKIIMKFMYFKACDRLIKNHITVRMCVLVILHWIEITKFIKENCIYKGKI